MNLWRKLGEKGKFTKKQKEIVTTLSLDTIDDDALEVFIPGDYSYVNSEVFSGLSKRAIVMVSKIMVELKFNNALWYFDTKINERDSGVITELRKKEILFKTGTTEIHLVNPFFIRKGRISHVIVYTLRTISGTPNVTTDHIKKLYGKGKSRISGFDFLTA